MDTSARDRFAVFFESTEPKLRRALCSAYGADVGSEAAAEALAWGWQNWSRMESINNQVGYLFRVGQTAARRQMSRREHLLGPDVGSSAELLPVEPTMTAALLKLPHNQRVAVVLVHGYDYRHREVAEILGCSTSTVANHVERALARLRDAVGVRDHA